MSERTDSLLMGRVDKSSLTEIIDTTHDAIEKITIEYKSGHTIIIKT